SEYHPKEFIRNLWVTIANGRVWRGTLRNRAKDDSIYWVDTTIVPFLNLEGKPRQYVAIRYDITSRKRLEEEAQDALKQVQDIQGALDESAIVAITDQTGKITYVNDRFCQISKYSREQFLPPHRPFVISEYHPKEFIRNLWVTIAN